MFEDRHHLVGEAELVGLELDIGPVAPLGDLEFRLIHLYRIVAVDIAEEAYEKVADDTPGLGLVIADILDSAKCAKPVLYFVTRILSPLVTPTITAGAITG